MSWGSIYLVKGTISQPIYAHSDSSWHCEAKRNMATNGWLNKMTDGQTDNGTDI